MLLRKARQNALLGHGRWSRRGQRCWDPFSRGGPATASPSVQLQPSSFGRYESPDFGQEEMPGDGEEDDLMYQEPEMVGLGQVVGEILWELRSCFFLVIAIGISVLSLQHFVVVEVSPNWIVDWLNVLVSIAGQQMPFHRRMRRNLLLRMMIMIIRHPSVGWSWFPTKMMQVQTFKTTWAFKRREGSRRPNQVLQANVDPKEWLLEVAEDDWRHALGLPSPRWHRIVVHTRRFEQRPWNASPVRDSHTYLYNYKIIYSYFLHVFCILPRRIMSVASWLCQVERVSAKLKVTMPNDSKEWRSVVSRVAQGVIRRSTGWRSQDQLLSHKSSHRHLWPGHTCSKQNSTSRWGNALEFLLFLIHMIFQRSFCLQPSCRQVIESQFPASKVLMGVMGSVVWTFLERKELSNFLHSVEFPRKSLQQTSQSYVQKSSIAHPDTPGWK